MALHMADRTSCVQGTVGRSRRTLYSLALVGVTFAICLVRLAGFVQANAVDLPFDDLWDSLNPLFKEEGPLACFFYQHGPPRMGLGSLIERYLYQETHWD